MGVRKAGNLIARDEYGRVMVAILVMYLASAVLGQGRWQQLALVIVTAAVLLMAMESTGIHGRKRHIAWAVVGVTVLGSTAGAVLRPEPSAFVAWAWAAMSIWSIVLIFKSLARHGEITIHTVAGVVCVYLLIGLAFSAIYRGIDLDTANGFFVQTDDPDVIDFTYFSFVTLTTLGFGDLTPASDLGKAVVTLEALLGQVFLVTVVSVVVANLGQSRQRTPLGPVPPEQEAPEDPGRAEGEIVDEAGELDEPGFR